MRGKDLLECMEYIDDALIQEALEPMTVVPHRKHLVAKWGMVAACIVVIGISATAFWSHQNVKNGQMESAGDTTSPAAMNTAANDDSAVSLSEDSLTAGAVAENAQAGDNKICSLPDANEYSEAGSASDSGNDAMSQSTAADAMSGKENARVEEMKAELELQDEEETAKLAYTIISDYYDEKDGSVYDYPVPEKGTILCYHYLKETMEYYAALEDTTDTAGSQVYAYDVVISVFGDVEIEGCRGIHYEQLNMVEDTNAGNEMIEQEYRRLAELGYAVRLSEDFQLTGIFTKGEIDTFQASPEYGYTFRFASEY